MDQEQYQKEYDEAAAKLDAAENGSTPEIVIVEEPATPESITEQPAPPEPEVDPLAELRAKLEKTEKSLKDTQAWGTKNSQRLAEMERERAAQQREADRPTILDNNPDLADAIRFVANDPAPQHQQQQKDEEWRGIIERVHPGIFAVDADAELVEALVARRDALGDEWLDPLVAIREISEEKLKHSERQIGKRFLVESRKLADKTAMSVPRPGGGTPRGPSTPDQDEVQRIKGLSDADFAREVRRVKGLL